MRPQTPPIHRIPFTKEGYQKLINERDQLLLDRPDAVDHLKKAREMGDLSENGYYKAARARLSGIDANLRRLTKLIRLGKIVDTKTTAGVVGFGSTVTLSVGSLTQIFTVVGGFESNPSEKTISHVSPLGKALMNKKVGDTVTINVPKGQITYTILHIQ